MPNKNKNNPIAKERYEIPEKDIVKGCFEKMRAEIGAIKSKNFYFNPIACKLLAGSNEFYNLCSSNSIDPLFFQSRGVPIYNGKGLSLMDQINSSKGLNISDIVCFVNNFISEDSYKVDSLLIKDLSREQYAKIIGKKWKDWSWQSVFFGRLGIKYIHKTGLGQFNNETTEEDIQEELKNARTKAKKVVLEKILGPSQSSVMAKEEGRKLIDYAFQIDTVIDNYVRYSNLRPDWVAKRGGE